MQHLRAMMALAFATGSLCSTPASASPSAAGLASQPFFHVRLRAGDAIENIFERTRYLSAPHRVSGYATYAIVGTRGNRLEIRTSFAYYGRISKRDVPVAIEFRPDGVYAVGRKTSSLLTDSSGAFYNPWIWGNAPATLTAGQTWQYRIPRAWELGPAGMQTIRVLSLDSANDRIVLQKTGSGSGAPLDETPPPVDGVATQWGTTTWKGIATVRRGLIESEQIAVHHEIIVAATANKPRRTLDMIEQIELGQTPYDGRLP